jgi:hypothetical protein
VYAGTEPLTFPPHFPPTTRWKKFFIGVRWLGPDLSFFKAMRRQQASRVQSQMDVWGSGKEREIAELLSQAFRQEVRWPASVVLPGDSFQVMSHGPAFGMIDDLGSISAIKRLEKHYGIHIPNSFWAGREKSAFGEIVEALTGLLAQNSI